MSPVYNNRYCLLAWLARLVTLVALLYLGACAKEAGSNFAAASEAAASSRRAIGDAGRYVLQIEIPAQTIVLGDGSYQQWLVRVQNSRGENVYPAKIGLNGGMPGHGHGLPSQPRVTEYLGEGNYRIEGLKFTMAGSWQLVFYVDARSGSDRIEFNFEVEH